MYRCEIVEARNLADAVGIARSSAASQQCCDCGISLCASHETCDIVTISFACAACLTRPNIRSQPQRAQQAASVRPLESNKTMTLRFGTQVFVAIACLLLLLAQTAFGQSNEVLGEIELVGASNVEKTSGVWVDGQYLGYLKELKGSKKILLLPGQHEIAVRQDGYHEFTQKIAVRPGEKQTISVKMIKDPRFQMPSVFSEIKLSVTP